VPARRTSDLTRLSKGYHHCDYLSTSRHWPLNLLDTRRTTQRWRSVKQVLIGQAVKKKHPILWNLLWSLSNRRKQTTKSPLRETTVSVFRTLAPYSTVHYTFTAITVRASHLTPHEISLHIREGLPNRKKPHKQLFNTYKISMSGHSFCLAGILKYKFMPLAPAKNPFPVTATLKS
jgi:hypothetical protein